MLIDFHVAARMQQAVLWLLLLTALIIQSSKIYGTPVNNRNSTAEQALSLSKAVQKILKHNPSLQGFQPRFRQLAGLQQSADQAPSYQLGIEAENLSGSGDYAAFDSAELTVSLGSVIEFGDKRSSRIKAAQSRYQLEQANLKVQTIDVLGQATQSFISLLSIQQQIKLAEEAVALAAATLDIVQQRVKKGAVFQAEATRAKAALAQAKLPLDVLQSQFQIQQTQLSILWGEPEPQFNYVSGDLFAFSEVKSYQELMQALLASPALQIYADRLRVQNAEIQLSRSASQSDISWQVGIKHDSGNGDAAFNAGFTMPLFSKNRNQGAVTAAIAAKESIAYEQKAQQLQLQAKLYQAYRTRQQQLATVKRLQSTILPALEASLKQTSKAYQSGRYSYIDWVGAQRELLAARHMMVQAATNVLRNQSLIEQLTAQSLAPKSFSGMQAVKQITHQD